MLTLKYEIEGERQLSRRLRGIGDEVQDWKPAFEEATRELKEIFANDVFATRGRAINENWKPLSPVTIAQKARQGYPTDPLIRTGRMKNSFNAQATSMSGVIWNSTAYFKYHQSNQPRKKLPRRAMMKLGLQQRELVVKVFHTHYMKKIGRA